MNEFERHWTESLPTLGRLAKRITTCREDAEDLLADTALRLLQAFYSFCPEGSFQNWSCRALMRTWIDTIRTRRREVSTIKFDDLTPEDELEILSALSDNGAIWTMGEEVQLGLDALVQEERDLIFALAEGYRPAEIAEQSGCDWATIRSRIARARNKAIVAAHAAHR